MVQDTVVVVGMKFGKNYVDIAKTIPGIKKVIGTRTSLEGAKKTIEDLKAKGSSQAELVPAQVQNAEDLEKIVKQENPKVVVIATPTPFHVAYTNLAAQYTNVLCEKPYSEPVHDGRARLELAKLKKGHKVGLELPFAIAGHDYVMRSLFTMAHEIEFHWESKGASSDIISDLALHPWSLLPRDYKKKIKGVQQMTNYALLGVTVEKPDRTKADAVFTLRYGGNFKGFSIDGQTYVIKIAGASNKIIRVPGTLDKAIRMGMDALDGEVVLSLENPLKEHLKGMLDDKPICGVQDMYWTQRFLDRAHYLRTRD